MDQPARLYLCARCRAQVILCSRCDRGNRYCGRQCRHQARQQARREAAQRYQRSWRGRIAHAQRSRRWRQRHAARGGCSMAGDDAHNVTHQGSKSAPACAPLRAWTHDSATVTPDALVTVATAAPDPPPQEPTFGTPPTAPTCWACHRCGQCQPAALRLGFLRHGVFARRHDHSP